MCKQTFLCSWLQYPVDTGSRGACRDGSGECQDPQGDKTEDSQPGLTVDACAPPGYSRRVHTTFCWKNTRSANTIIL